jgi:hypothetical protein
MTRSRSMFGALLLCAFCLLAFGGSNASATSTYVCEEVAANTGGFTDSHCTTKGIGNFATIKAAKTIKIKSTNTTIFTIRFNIGGVKVHIECELEEGTGSGTNEVVEGASQGVGKELTAQLSKCVVHEPLGSECKIKGGGFEMAPAQSTTFMVSEEVTGVKITPTTGKTLFKITAEGCKSAGLNGTYSAEGALVGIVNKESPSQLEFTEASSKEGNLTIGGNLVTIITRLHSVVAGTEKTVSVEVP